MTAKPIPPALLAAALALPAAADPRPNILYVFSDDHALNAISAYGGPLKDLAPTPNLDRIRDEGALFTRSFCANSICGPSRASVLTGKHSHVNGYVDNNNSRFDGSQTTFPQLFQAAGYQTALIGKWHLVSQPTGFDHWEILPGQGHYYNPDFITAEGRHRVEGYVTDIITDKTLSWIENERDPSRPFLMMTQHKAPHRNWSPASRHVHLWRDVDFPEPDTLFDDYSNRSATLARQEMSIANDFSWRHDMKFQGENLFPDYFNDHHGNAEYDRMTPEQKELWDAAYEPDNQAFIEAVRDGSLSGDDVTRWKYQRYIKDYLRTIRAVDENIGRLLAHLDESGLAENTIVIYSSDQGFFLGEHGWYDKRWMFEESLAMPFIIRWPGVVEPGSTANGMIQNIDHAPTFLEIAGIDIPSTMQGRSFLPILRGAGETPADWREAIYYYYSGEATHAVAAHDGVRTERHKLIHFTNEDEWNLFDLESDPQELRSLHDDPDHQETFAMMKSLYERLRRHYRMSPATLPAHRNREEWWRERHQANVAAARETRHDIVLIGDSITQGWGGAGQAAFEERLAPLGSILNLGFSGDRTQHVLWRLLNGGFDRQQPKAAVVMIGTNNTGHVMQDAEETADGIRLILENVLDRSPDTRVILHPIFPRGATADDAHRVRNDEINRLARPLAEDPRVTWLDLSDRFMDGEGTLDQELMPDLLHLSEDGYAIWAAALEEALAPLLAD